MKLAELKEKLQAFNRSVDKDMRFAFRVVTDRSLLNPRQKVCHNILENGRYIIVAYSAYHNTWYVQTHDHNELFRGKIDACFAFVRGR